MKKLFLLSIFAVFAMSSANAQDPAPAFGFSEGDVTIEGNVGFNSSNNKNSDTKSNGVTFSPRVSYFLNDDLAVGGSLSVNSSKTETAGTDTSKDSGFGVGVHARYYFLDLGARKKIYSEFGVGYGTIEDKLADLKTNTIGAGFDLGLHYFVTQTIALTFVLDDIFGYSSSKVDVSGAKAESNFNLGVGSVNNPFGGTANFGILVKL